jgi:hypothetical protein
MLRPSGRFEWLSAQFDTMLSIFNNTEDSRERARLLRRMKILIDEIEAFTVISPEREKQETTGSSQPCDSPPE